MFNNVSPLFMEGDFSERAWDGAGSEELFGEMRVYEAIKVCGFKKLGRAKVKVLRDLFRGVKEFDEAIDKLLSVIDRAGGKMGSRAREPAIRRAFNEGKE